MKLSPMKIKTLAGIGGVATVLALTATPALAAVDTGNETITSPSSPYTPSVDANGNPIDSNVVVTGTGYGTGQVYGIICDGKSPSAPGWTPELDCDNLTATSAFPAGSDGAKPGQIILNGADPNYQIGVFRGESPNDQFNCLAPGDNPNASSVTVSNPADSTQVAPIDPTKPSWGASTYNKSVGGGTTPCQIRVAYSDTVADSSSDKYITLSLPQNGTSGGTSPGTQVPESPLAIALPVGAVALFGTAGVVLFRKRRTSTAS
jgi:hypothetical protein